MIRPSRTLTVRNDGPWLSIPKSRENVVAAVHRQIFSPLNSMKIEVILQPLILDDANPVCHRNNRRTRIHFAVVHWHRITFQASHILLHFLYHCWQRSLTTFIRQLFVLNLNQYSAPFCTSNWLLHIFLEAETTVLLPPSLSYSGVAVSNHCSL